MVGSMPVFFKFQLNLANVSHKFINQAMKYIDITLFL